jgi:hypothetical protein
VLGIQAYADMIVSSRDVLKALPLRREAYEDPFPCSQGWKERYKSSFLWSSWVENKRDVHRETEVAE